MKRLLFLLFCILTACNAHMVTMERYQDVSIGLTRSDLIELFGNPYEVRQKGPDAVEYEYIERVTAADRVLFLRHYFFLIQGGKVVAKRMANDKEVPLDDRNAYDLQTSKNSIDY